jgi:hypothetical protein
MQLSPEKEAGYPDAKGPALFFMILIISISSIF